jgi:kynurenine formamidase
MSTPVPAPSPAGADLYGALAAGVTIDLAQPLEAGMPCSPSHPGFTMSLIRRHGDAAKPLAAANELIVTGGHVGTHVDALCHASRDGRLHGGHDATEAVRAGRFAVHGVETVPPFICRGVLADIPRLKGIGRLAPEYGITAADIRAALTGVAVEAGDVVLVRTGWPQLYADPAAYVGWETGVPGITEEAAVFLADLGVRAVGSDTIATDRIRAGSGHSRLPAHFTLLVDRGVPIIEVLDLEELAATGEREFLFIAIPLKITGATGSPVRPIAVLPSRTGQSETRRESHDD